ncbi:phage head spike fiber domain-containing protein [Endozoicomonas lisbonensis]
MQELVDAVEALIADFEKEFEQLYQAADKFRDHVDNHHRYAVPHPDLWLPLTSDHHLREGFGGTEFRRNSPGFYVNKSGYPVRAGVDELRIEKKGYLVEQRSTNHSAYSNKPGEWRQSANVEIKEGGQFGDLNIAIVTPKAEGTKRLYRAVAADLSGTKDGAITCSLFVKEDDYNEYRFRFASDSVFYADIVIDIATEERITGGDLPFKFDYLAEGWKRVSVTYTPPDPERLKTIKGEVWLYIDGRADSEPDGESSFTCAGHQWEALPFASSLIETDDTAATRQPDYLDVDVENNWTPHGYTMHLKGSLLAGYEGHSMAFFGVPGYSYNLLRRNSTSSVNHIRWYTDSSGCGFHVDDITETNSFTLVSHGSGNTKRAYVNGLFVDERVTPDTNPGTPNRIAIGYSGNSGGSTGFFGHIADFRVYLEPLNSYQAMTLG